jgi:hypothetical protein
MPGLELEIGMSFLPYLGALISKSKGLQVDYSAFNSGT